MNDLDEDGYTGKEISNILKEVKQNPTGHKYPPELISKFQAFENSALKHLERSPIFQLEKSMQGINAKLGVNNAFRFTTEQSPYFQIARKMEQTIARLTYEDPFKKIMEESPYFKMAQNLERITKSLPSLYGEIYDDFSFLSEEGWYLSPRIFDQISFSELHKNFRTKDIVELERLILKEGEKLISEIIKNCISGFENRMDIFIEIQSLFDHGFYRSVVALCYTQADGICNDTWEVGFFDKDKHQDWKLKTYLKFKQLGLKYPSSVMSQLDIQGNEITANSKGAMFQDNDKKKTSFNRHLILHGHSINYGTKENAIRAICLLDFLHFITQEAVEVNS